MRNGSPQVNATSRRLLKSGRKDLNLRPHGPEPCALAKLSYAPSVVMIKIDPLSSTSINRQPGTSAGSRSVLFLLLRLLRRADETELRTQVVTDAVNLVVHVDVER